MSRCRTVGTPSRSAWGPPRCRQPGSGRSAAGGSSVSSLGGKCEYGGPGHHVPAHPARLVELCGGQERADPFAAVPASLAERELDLTADAAVHDVVSPSLHVARVDEAAQLLESAEELTALARVIRRPLDRELHVLGHQLE